MYDFVDVFLRALVGFLNICQSVRLGETTVDLFID